MPDFPFNFTNDIRCISDKNSLYALFYVFEGVCKLENLSMGTQMKNGLRELFYTFTICLENFSRAYTCNKSEYSRFRSTYSTKISSHFQRFHSEYRTNIPHVSKVYIKNILICAFSYVTTALGSLIFIFNSIAFNYLLPSIWSY